MFKKYEDEIENRRLYNDDKIYKKFLHDWFRIKENEQEEKRRKCYWQDFQEKIKDRLNLLNKYNYRDFLEKIKDRLI